MADTTKNSNRVYVTGIGIISGIGNDAKENLFSLQNSKTGISNSKFFKSKYADLLKFSEVKLSNEQLVEQIDVNDTSDFTRTDLLAFKAFDEAITNSKLNQVELSSKSTAFISSSTVGGMCITDQLYEDANKMKGGSPFLRSYSGGSHLLKIAKHYQLKGFTDTINTACSSSANAIMLGSRLIKSGRIDRAIVGGTDSLAKFTVNGFNALQILSTEACKPFDENRVGLTLGEAAGFVVLESETVCKDKTKLAVISGYGNTNDAFHPSSLSDEAIGVILSMQYAIDSANLKASEIDYVNTHGTATNNNDQTEIYGLNELFTKKIPPFNSTKSYTGHTLAAAGVVEAIYSIFSINNSELYKSLNVENPIQPFNFLPINSYQKNIEIQHVLSNSFGFGGNCTSLIISKVV